MSFVQPKPVGWQPPLPPPPFDASRLAERDRFGLPLDRPSLLSESPAEREARIALVKSLAADMVRAVVEHLGREEAKRLIEQAFDPLPAKGKSANHQRNWKLLEEYDLELVSAPGEERKIPQRLAKRYYPDNKDSCDSLARHIRRLVASRRRDQSRKEEWEKQRIPTLLERVNPDQ